MREILLTSCILIPVVLLLRAALGKKISMRLRYALWLLVAIRLLLPVQFGQSKLSVENVIEQLPKSEQPLVLTIESDSHVPSVPTEQQPSTAQQEGISSEQLARGVWYVGIGGMALWYLTVNFHFYYKARKCAKRLNLPDVRLRVYVSEGVSSPCLLGSSIFLTPEIASDESKRTHVLAHEMTHFYHADSLWSIVRAVCLCVYWFHPLVWCAAILSKQDCELACDEGAIKRLGETERYSYGKTLICVAARASKMQTLLHTATTMSQSKKQLTERIKIIATKQKRPISAVLLLCFLLSLTVACTFTSSAVETDAAAPQSRQPMELTFADSVTTERKNSQMQETTRTTLTRPTQKQTEPETTRATEMMQETEPIRVPETTQPYVWEETSPIFAVKPTEYPLMDGCYLGEFTIKEGEILSLQAYVSEPISIYASNLNVMLGVTGVGPTPVFPGYGMARLKIVGSSVGTTEIYFSQYGNTYVAATIHVVEG